MNKGGFGAEVVLFPPPKAIGGHCGENLRSVAFKDAGEVGSEDDEGGADLGKGVSALSTFPSLVVFVSHSRHVGN